jgi:hypothetical protein
LFLRASLLAALEKEGRIMIENPHGEPMLLARRLKDERAV